MNKVIGQQGNINTGEFLIRYEQPGQVLYTQWQALASIHRASPALEQLLGVVRQEEVGAWLLDLHNMPDLLMLDQQWLEYQYLPRVAALSLRHLALVLKSEWQHHTLLYANILPPAFEVQIFDDTASALDWLRQVAGPRASQAPALETGQWAASA